MSVAIRLAALVLLAAVVAGAQEAPIAAQAPAPPSDGDTVSDGPPDPSLWMYEPDASPRDLLSRPPIDPADLRTRLPEYEEVLASHGLMLDLEQGTVSVRGATLHDEQTLGYPIEYLVVTELGKTHEAAVIIRAQPSVLDACLRALELEPGTPTRFQLKDPPPSPEELEAGAEEWDTFPAKGPLVLIDVSWIDETGRPHTTSLDSMLLDIREGEPLTDRGWIYTGSTYTEFRKGRDYVRWFKADALGDVVAIYLAGLDVCLFERNSLDGIDDTLYVLNPDVVPPVRTPVTLTFRPTGAIVTTGTGESGGPEDEGEAAPSGPSEG